MSLLTSSKSGARSGWILGTMLVATALFLLRYGYGFGYSDQDEFLPLVARILDKDLFQADWFVSMQFEGFSIRWPMAVLVALPATLLPVWSVVLLLHLSTAMISARAVAHLTDRIFNSRLVTLAVTVAVLSITSRWNPGGNDILHGLLVPSSVAWCLVLSAVERLHARHFMTSGLLLGGAALFHPLLGLQAGGILLVVVLTWSAISNRQRLRLALPFLIVAVPITAKLASIGTAGPEATTILTDLRAPHHYLPGSFALSSWILFSILAVGAGSMLAWYGRSNIPRSIPPATTSQFIIAQRDRAFLLRLLLVPTGLLVFSLLLTAWPIQWPLALRLQPWAASPLVRVMATMTLVGSSIHWFQSKGAVWSFRGARMEATQRSAILIVLGGIMLLYALHANKDALRGSQHPDHALHNWAEENSPMDAVFVVPPSMTGFQYGAQRAQYVSFKSFPFASEPTLEWWQRLQDIAPLERIGTGGTALLQQLDSAYTHRPLGDMRTYVARHDVDFIVRPQPDPADWQDLETAEWCSERWCVFWAGRILTQPARPSLP